MKNNFLKGLAFVGALLCFSMVQAQTVSGTVSDATGPLPGANVLVKGTTNGTQTDFDGNYSLDNVDANATLVFSYVGFSSKEIPVNGQSTINATLTEDAQALDEVVVIGYGTTTKQDATGAVDVVSSEDFNQGVIASPEQLIQGRTAGVQVSQTSGEPGAGVQVRIRGTASVRSNNNPLFVVDGVPLSGGDTSAGGSQDLGAGVSSAKNPLNFLNPNDIESMTILKDASATAIYGSRAANGVIIITTKSGKAGQGGKFEFNSSTSVSKAAKTFDLLDRDQFLGAIDQYGGDSSALDFGNNTDWQDYILRTAFSNDQNLSYSNNYGSGFVRGSFSYSDQNGVLENSSQQRITGRINLSQRFLDDKLKIDFNGTISNVDNEAPFISNNSGSLGDLLGSTYFANPTWPTDPTFSTGSNLIPSQALNYFKDITDTNRYLANISAEYEIVEGLKAKVNLGYDESSAERNQALSGNITGLGNGAPVNGRGVLFNTYTKNELLDATLNYQKDFGNSKLEALVGYSYQSFKSAGSTVQGFGYTSQNMDIMFDELQNASRIIENSIAGSYQQYGYDPDGLFVNRLFPDISGNEVLPTPTGIDLTSVAADNYNNTDYLQSFFTRLNYTLMDKYIFTFTLRADGSSRFGPDNAYGYFPSGAFAWRMDQEDFVGESFSTLKLRLGYGITGNQEGLGYGNFTFRQRFGGIGIANNGDINPPAINLVAFPNSDLKWEETAQANIGLDFGFMNDRLNGSVDLYHKTTNDLILRQEAAQPSPQPFYFGNVDADVINKGVEFAINYDIIQNEDFNWNMGFNIAYNHNMVENFDGQIQTGEINGNGLTGAFAQLLAGGQPLFSYYLREFGGFDENGISIYPNGDVQEFVDKSALPKVTSGLSTSFSYKNWSLNAFFAGQFGQYIYNNTQNAFFTAGIINSGQNVTEDVLTNGESPANAPDVSTRFLEKGDFVRLQNASIGYNVPIGEDWFLDMLKFTVTGQNLFVITGYSGLDPEVNTPKPLNDIPSLGIDYTSFPRPRTVTFGINASF
ncbi:SusC/RagA family TonB-linked outer membrane protein [Galbibacter mesophilus]|uniref:SusC/RagA family TonB-linked outer membrane protein n=1 Tax=Galbibacter mesophilus TaxID=379069 RepID=UPI00191EA748|nr:SusC/RagA family TonB-linked outer membrane protein [Galbibacter mesophilus]MCM5661913.1 SusC/RagA family TonB-linked outer membrane protein [Galbibacter mesophilus]